MREMTQEEVEDLVFTTPDGLMFCASSSLFSKVRENVKKYGYKPYGTTKDVKVGDLTIRYQRLKK